MTDTGRIRIAKDKANLVKTLASSDGATGPFQTYADVIVFAAALGAKHKKRVPLGEISKREPSPIGQEHFFIKGYDFIIKLLAMNEYKKIDILSSSNNYENKRLRIFEEYANGGLEILQNELRGAVDYLDRLLLILISERFNKTLGNELSFDLSRFLE